MRTAHGAPLVCYSPLRRWPAAVVLLSGGLDSTTALAVARSQGFACYALTVKLWPAPRGRARGGPPRRACARRRRPSHRGGGPRGARRVGVDLARRRRAQGSAARRDRRTRRRARDLRAGAQHRAAIARARLGRVARGARPVRRRQRARRERLSRLPARVRARVRGARAGRDARRRVSRARAADRAHEGADIELGTRLGVDYAATHSCYDPVMASEAGPDAIADRACGRCDACTLRRKGFAEAGIPDPTRYKIGS